MVYPYETGKKKLLPEENKYAKAAAALGGSVISAMKPVEEKANPAANLVAGAMSRASTPPPVQQQQSVPTITPRPVSDNVKSLMDMLTTKANSAPATSEQIMASPEYTNQANAIDALATRDMGVLRSDLMGDFASRGMLRSTPANQAVTSALGDVTLKSNAQKASLIPQMIQAADVRRQNDIANAATLLSKALGIEDQSWTQGYNEANMQAPYLYLTKGQQEEIARSDRNYERGVYESDRTYDRGVMEGDRTFAVNEANITGKYNGEETQGSKLQKLQIEREQRQGELDKLKADIAANPLYGLTAQAKLDIEKGEKELSRLDAEISATYALRDQRLKPDDPKETDADKRYEATRTANINNLTSMYTVSRPGAELWQDFTEIASSINDATGKPYTPMEKEKLFTKMVSDSNALSGGDRYILPALWQSSQGVPGSADALAPYRRTQTPYERE